MYKNFFLFITLLSLALLFTPTISAVEEMTTTETEGVESYIQTTVVPTTTKNDEFKKARHEMEQRKLLMDQKQGMKHEFQQQIKQKREENMAKMKSEREQFKLKITELKDARKKTIVEKIDGKLSNLNRVRTDHFANVLDRLSMILDKAEERVAGMKSSGKDTSAVETAIASARTAIASAKTAVEAQAVKEYVIPVTDDTTLKTDTQTTVQTIQADLKATQDAVMKAKEAVQIVFSELKKLEI